MRIIIEGKCYEVEQVDDNSFRFHGESAIGDMIHLIEWNQNFNVFFENKDPFLARIIRVLARDNLNHFIEVELVNISSIVKPTRLKSTKILERIGEDKDLNLYFDNDYHVGISFRKNYTSEAVINNLKAIIRLIEHMDD